MSVSVTLAAGQPFMQWSLEIVTPSHLRDVDPFAHLLDQVRQTDVLPGDPEVTCRVTVLLVASAALPSCLEPLRALVREVPFPQRSTGPVTFFVGAEDANRADHPFIGRAVSLICHDCIGNPNAPSKSIIIATGAAPRRELLEPLVQRAFRQPGVGLHVYDFDVPLPLSLVLTSKVDPGTRISAPTGMATMVMKSLLKCEDEDSPEDLKIFVMAVALPGLEQALREHPNHQYRSMSFYRYGEEPSDATDVCAAAMLCPRSSLEVKFRRFHFDKASRSPLIAGMDEVDPVLLENLDLALCKFGPGAVPFLAKRPARALTVFSCVGGGDADLAITMAQTGTLSTLGLNKVPLDVIEMARLRNILTAEGCIVSTLTIGGRAQDGTNCMSYEAADHFFHDLPNMKSLRALTCYHIAPIAQSRTILRGVDRNYGLREVSGLIFESPDPEASSRLKSEVASFAQSNARGRDTVFASVQNPGSAALRGAALGAIHRLASIKGGGGGSDDDNGTALYLCVRLFLPGVALAAAAGAAAAAAAPLHDSSSAAASTEREAQETRRRGRTTPSPDSSRPAKRR